MNTVQASPSPSPSQSPSETGEKSTNILRACVALFGLIVFGVAFGVTVWAKNDEISKSFPILVGAIVSLVSTISGYYFGSSAGSQKKDGTISDIVRTAQAEGGHTEGGGHRPGEG
jgi:hypothetical protein